MENPRNTSGWGLYISRRRDTPRIWPVTMQTRYPRAVKMYLTRGQGLAKSTRGLKKHPNPYNSGVPFGDNGEDASGRDKPRSFVPRVVFSGTKIYGGKKSRIKGKPQSDRCVWRVDVFERIDFQTKFASSIRSAFRMRTGDKKWYHKYEESCFVFMRRSRNADREK